MKEDLENISVPKVELVSHQQSLRRALLKSECFRERPGVFWIKRLAPVGAMLALILFFTSQVISTKVQESSAMKIIQNDLEIQKLNLDFSQVKMVAKSTYLPSPESSVIVSTISPAIIYPSATPVPSVSATKEDKMMSVEVNDGKSKYTVLVNMTHKKVEKIKQEPEDNKKRQENQASSTETIRRTDKNEKD